MRFERNVTEKGLWRIWFDSGRSLDVTFGLGFSLFIYKMGDPPDIDLNIHLGWPNIFIPLPFSCEDHSSDCGISDGWGLGWFDGELHLKWGCRGKIIRPYWAGIDIT